MRDNATTRLRKRQQEGGAVRGRQETLVAATMTAVTTATATAMVALTVAMVTSVTTTATATVAAATATAAKKNNQLKPAAEKAATAVNASLASILLAS